MTDFPVIGWYIIAASFVPLIILCAGIWRINATV